MSVCHFTEESAVSMMQLLNHPLQRPGREEMFLGDIKRETLMNLSDAITDVPKSVSSFRRPILSKKQLFKKEFSYPFIIKVCRETMTDQQTNQTHLGITKRSCRKTRRLSDRYLKQRDWKTIAICYRVYVVRGYAATYQIVRTKQLKRITKQRL